METDEVAKRRGRPPKVGSGNGQAGTAASGAGLLDEADEGWSAFKGRLLSAEKEQPKRRIVRVWHPEAPDDIWHGEHCSAPVEVGYVAYQWNNGEICG